MEPEFIGQIVAIIVATILYSAYQIYKKNRYAKSLKETNGRPRSMSFNSSVFLSGVFPKDAEVRPAVINCLFLFKTCPSSILLEDACKKLIYFDRFRSAVKFDGKEWKFVERDINFQDHILTARVTSEKSIMDECDNIMKNDFDLGEGDSVKPLWVFQRIINEGAGFDGLLIRIHHSIADGISLVNALSKILTDENGKPLEVNLPEGKISAKELSGKDKKHVLSPTFIDKVKSLFQIISLPVSKYDTKTLFSPSNMETLKMTKKRKNIIFPTLKLEFVKSIKNKAHVTVNDVLLSTMTGAIKRYCARRGDPTVQEGKDDKLLSSRCLMPVSLPRSSREFADPATALRNYWVMVSVPLPLLPTTAVQRLNKCHEITSEVKKSPTSGIQMWLQQLLPNILPKFLQEKTAYDIFSRHTLVFSNVPGPSNLISLCGEQVVDDDEIPGAEEDLPKCFIEELTELGVSYQIDTEHMLADISPGGYFGFSKHP